MERAFSGVNAVDGAIAAAPAGTGSGIRANKLTRAGQVDPHQEKIRQGRQRGSSTTAALLKTALREDRLFFAFQPVVCATTGETDYFECLLRMRDEAGDIVASADFITNIERLGLIGLIDRFV